MFVKFAATPFPEAALINELRVCERMGSIDLSSLFSGLSHSVLCSSLCSREAAASLVQGAFCGANLEHSKHDLVHRKGTSSESMKSMSLSAKIPQVISSGVSNSADIARTLDLLGAASWIIAKFKLICRLQKAPPFCCSFSIWMYYVCIMIRICRVIT